MAHGRQDISYQKKEFATMFSSCLSSACQCQAGSQPRLFLFLEKAPFCYIQFGQGDGSSPISTHRPYRHQIAIAGIALPTSKVNPY
jgi:hypothetical protein